MDALNQNVSIPAVCRIPGRGTAFLVATGVLMTTTAVIPSAREAARCVAVFFEGSKKTPVEVKLLPDRLYFAAMFPEHVNYCIVACETTGIYNVVPVSVPLVRSQWTTAQEGDTLLIAQHRMTGNAAVDAEVRLTARFEEVLRRRDDLYYVKTDGTTTAAGCPVFNDNSQLVGIYSQFRSESEGLVSRVLSVVTIVKHLFANGLCGKLQEIPPFEDIWDTWYAPNDTPRVISIMANFRNKAVLGEAMRRLCEHTAKRDLVEGVVACGGTKIIVACMVQFRETEELARNAIRSLWDISFGAPDNSHQIVEAGGVEAVLDLAELYHNNEEICEYAIVLLYNIAATESLISTAWGERCVKVTMACLARFTAPVLQKFALGLLTSLCAKISAMSAIIVEGGIVDHLGRLAKEHGPSNTLLIENVARLYAVVASTQWSSPLLRPAVDTVITLMSTHESSNTVMLHGNRALWALGAAPEARVEILRHPQGAKALLASVPSLLTSIGRDVR